MPAVETVLVGGTANRGLVVRVGDTVRRPLRPSGPAVQALLEHLRQVGFSSGPEGGAPIFLGVDEQGREVLSYLPGETVTAPYPAWSMTDEALDSVAHLLKRYHQAVAEFDPDDHPWAEPVPPEYVTGLVSHNDPNLDNIVFRDGVAVALIDFDLVGPGSALWDVAAAIRLWAPLRPDPDITDARHGRALTRLRRFADAYGLDEPDRTRLIDAMRHEPHLVHGLRPPRRRSRPPWFRQRWTTGEADLTTRTDQWFETHHTSLQQALFT